jgi:hypothetical protein
MHARPLSVTVLAWLFIAMGGIGFVLHFPGLRAGEIFRYDGLWIELVQLSAIVAGIWMLRARNWARWLALAWMALHVALSVFHPWSQLAIHTLFLGVIAYILFRPAAARYFRRPAPAPGETTPQ